MNNENENQKQESDEPPTTVIQPYQEPGELEIDLDKVKTGLQKIKQFQKLVRELTTPGVDYGKIPGTDKPTLLKPGAEKIAKLMNLADSYIILQTQEDYNKPFFAFTVKCQLHSIRTGKLISEGVGQCNSYESKYRYRWVYESDLPPTIDKSMAYKKQFTSKSGGKYFKYRIDNEDICTQVNTILKMAKKRALVDAALSAGRLSEIFTQDMDDISNNVSQEMAKDFEAEHGLEVLSSDEQQHTEPKSDKPISTTQRGELFKLCIKYSVAEERLKKYLVDNYKIDSTAQIKKSQYDEICRWIETGKSPREPSVEG